MKMFTPVKRAVFLCFCANLSLMASLYSAASNDLAESLKSLHDGDVDAYGTDVIKMWAAPMPKPEKLGAGYPEIDGVRHVLIFAATEDTGGYNHHAQIIEHNGTFCALWSNNRYFEDAPGQRVLYSTSEDGLEWTSFAEAFPSPGPFLKKEEVGMLLTTLGWAQVDGKLYAMAKLTAMDGFRNPDGTLFSEKKDRSRNIIYDKRIYYGVLARELKEDGTWGSIFVVQGKAPASDEIDFPIVSRDECISGDAFKALLNASKEYTYPWGNKLPKNSTPSLLCEPSTYRLDEDTLVTLFRDQRYSHRLFVSSSEDGGETWSAAYPTNIPDSPSYTKALRLDDGTVVMVGNQNAEEKNFDQPKPAHMKRDPLVLSVSKDGGLSFGKAYALRAGRHSFRVPGVGGRGYTGGQYPSLMQVKDKLFVIYSMGKEDICVSIVPLDAIESDG